MRKVYANADEALAGQIKDGMTLDGRRISACAGFPRR